jgi:hypothetical protein
MSPVTFDLVACDLFPLQRACVQFPAASRRPSPVLSLKQDVLTASTTTGTTPTSARCVCDRRHGSALIKDVFASDASDPSDQPLHRICKLSVMKKCGRMYVTLLHVGSAEHQATCGLPMAVECKSMNAGQLTRQAKM